MCTLFIFIGLHAIVLFLVLLYFFYYYCCCCCCYYYYYYWSQCRTKPTKWHVRPAKTQISLDIRPVWLESLLSTWRKLWSLATHWAHSKDWSDPADAKADLRLRWEHMPFWMFCYALAHWFNINIGRRFDTSKIHLSPYTSFLLTLAVIKRRIRCFCGLSYLLPYWCLTH